MTAPFRGSGPWRGRGPFLGRGPWAGKAPFGFNAGLPFQINVTGAQLRDALADPGAWGLQPHNLLAYSDLFSDNAAWLKAYVTQTSGAGDPFGGTGAFTMTETAVLDQHYTAAQNRDWIAGQEYTASVYMRAGVGIRYGQLAFSASAFPASQRKARFDLQAGVPVLVESGGTVSMTAVGGGWYRCTMTRTCTTSATAYGVSVGMYQATEAWLGDGVSGIQVFRAQVNLGPTALHPVLTTGTASTQTHGWLLPGLGGARLSGDCRTSVAMQTAVDGTVGYAAHNLLTYSQLLTNAAWTSAGSASVGSATTAPNGTATAFPVTFSTPANSQIFQSYSLAAQPWTASVYARSVSGKKFRLKVYTGVSDVLSSDLTPDGTWQRFSFSGTSAVANVALCNESATISGTVEFWGAQLNLGSVATAYVPTTTAARYGPAIDWLAGIGAYGIRSESARTNLVLWSADMGNAAWLIAGAGATKVGAATALGAVPMYRVNVGTAAGSSFVYQTSITVSNATAYTQSVIVRAVSGTSAFRVAYFDGSVWRFSSDQLATTSPQVFQVSYTSAGTNNAVGVAPATAGGVVGDIEVGGFQLEAGTEASSRILTLAAAATRAADTLDVLDSGWINQTAGSIVVEGITRSIGANGYVSLNDGTASNRIDLRSGAPSYASVGGVTQAEITLAETVAGALTRSAFAYAANDFAGVRNGGVPSTDVSGTVPAMTRMQLGGIDGGVANNLRGHITRIRYSRRRASNGQLQALTV